MKPQQRRRDCHVEECERDESGSRGRVDSARHRHGPPLLAVERWPRPPGLLEFRPHHSIPKLRPNSRRRSSSRRRPPLAWRWPLAAATDSTRHDSPKTLADSVKVAHRWTTGRPPRSAGTVTRGTWTNPVRASCAAAQKPCSTSIGHFVVARATDITIRKGTAARRVPSLNRTSVPAMISTLPTKGPRVSGAGNPIFVNRPLPNSSLETGTSGPPRTGTPLRP
jgi:hypothetical protein